MKRNLTIPFLAGVFLSAAALFLAFRNVPLSELFDYFGSIDYSWVLLSVPVALFSFMLRVYRWQIILTTAKRIGFWRAFHPLMIGFAVNCILPGRLGEIVRPAVLKKRENVPMMTGFATVLTERVFDIGLLVALFAIVLSTVRIQPDLNIEFGSYRLNRGTLEAISGGMIKACMALVLGVFLISFSRTRKIISRGITRMPDLFFFLGGNLQERIRRFLTIPLNRTLENVSEGFSLVRHPKKMVLCLGLSVMVWYSAALSIYLMTLGCPGVKGISFLESTAMLVIICFFIALPSVPGFWGLWEAGGIFALSLFGISNQDAAGFTLANHAVQMVPVILVGLVSAIITGVNILKVAYESDVT